MKKLRTHIAYLLLMVFTWVSTPAHTIHHLFADHDVEEDFYCLLHHADLGTHFDEAHSDCDILKIDAPAFTIPESVQFDGISFLFQEAPASLYISNLSDYSYLLLPSRAPPAVL